MSKSNKATMRIRVDAVLQLILMGAQFPQIRQYALGQNWCVSDRQLRRYKQAAYRRMARTTKRKTEQSLGRHVMRREFLYARAIKDNDNRTALHILSDEAELLGLYSATKTGGTMATGQHALPHPPPLTCGERLARIMAAKASGDRGELKLMEHISPIHAFRLLDTDLPEMMLHTTTLEYVSIQLDHLVAFLYLMMRSKDEDDVLGLATRLMFLVAFRFRAVDEAWLKFTQRVGVDGDYLLKGNYMGEMLDLGRELIGSVSITPDYLRLFFSEAEEPLEELPSGDGLAMQWYRRFNRLLETPAG